MMKMACQRATQYAIHQGRLAATTGTRDRHQHAEGYGHIHTLQIVFLGIFNNDLT